MLYITTGEAGIPEMAQDLNSLGGKILRINPDGTIPDDNRFENSSVYSMDTDITTDLTGVKELARLQ